MELIGVDDFETHEMAAGAQAPEAGAAGEDFQVAPGQVA